MKVIINILIMIVFLISCKDKDTTPQPLPNATFTYKINNFNGISFYFTLNKDEVYTIDFGDGTIRTDNLEEGILSQAVEVSHPYEVNGTVTVILSIKSKNGFDKKQQVLQIENVLIAAFDHEIADNGRIKLNNVSKNATSYHWEISHLNTNGGKAFFVSTEKDINITIDLAGKYIITLVAKNKDGSKKISRMIDIKSARNQMEFTGYIKGIKKTGSLENNGLLYSTGFGGGGNGGLQYMGLYQNLIKLSSNYSSTILSFAEPDIIQTKFYPVFLYPLNQVNAEAYYSEARYNAVKKYLTKANDPDIVEVTEEILDPTFYNNTDFLYPKAFWIKFKVKNDELDGILKVRLVIWGIR